jgi:geranylgeranyl pyrophosphate synthase
VDIEKVRKVMRKSGALSYSQEKVVEFTNEAKSILIEGGFSHSIDFLLTLADFLRERVA